MLHISRFVWKMYIHVIFQTLIVLCTFYCFYNFHILYVSHPKVLTCGDLTLGATDVAISLPRIVPIFSMVILKVCWHPGYVFIDVVKDD